MRSENMGSSPTHSGASSCSTMAATMGGVPSAAPMPVSPLSVSTGISVASLFTLVPRSVRWRFSGGTGADIGMADTLTIFMGRFPCLGGSRPKNVIHRDQGPHRHVGSNGAMKLSLIVRGQHPPGDTLQHLQDDLELVRCADRLGFD